MTCHWKLQPGGGNDSTEDVDVDSDGVSVSGVNSHGCHDGGDNNDDQKKKKEKKKVI